MMFSQKGVKLRSLSLKLLLRKLAEALAMRGALL